jgi:hypothetical protein
VAAIDLHAQQDLLDLQQRCVTCKEPMTHTVLETRGHMRKELLSLDVAALHVRARAGGIPAEHIRAALATPPVPNYLGFRPGDLEASDVSAFVPPYLQENPHFSVEYHKSCLSFLLCRKRQKGSRLSAHHKLFWIFPGRVRPPRQGQTPAWTDFAFPWRWYVEMPDRPRRGEPLYTQYAPAKLKVNFYSCNYY